MPTPAITITKHARHQWAARAASTPGTIEDFVAGASCRRRSPRWVVLERRTQHGTRWLTNADFPGFVGVVRDSRLVTVMSRADTRASVRMRARSEMIRTAA